MKILLLGQNGQVGCELQRSLAPLGELLALDRHSTSHCGDLSNLEGLADTVRVFRPDVVVNAAACVVPKLAACKVVMATTWAVVNLATCAEVMALICVEVSAANCVSVEMALT